MFRKIIEWSTFNKTKTLILVGIISVLGVIAGLNMKVDVLPDINKPVVSVFADADGFAPEEIEELILAPLENALLGTPQVDRVRGVASFGLAIVNLEFSFGSDLYLNRQLVQERISKVSLPDGVEVSIGPTSSILGEILWIGVTAENMDSIDLRTYTDSIVKPNILKSEGIADVIVMGGDVLEWQVRLNADAMTKLGISQRMVNDILRSNLSNTSGGLLTQQNKEYPVRVFISPKSFDELQSLVIQTKSGQVRLGEIASFVRGTSQVRGTASVDGKQGIVMRIFKQPNAETLSVTKSVDQVIEELQSTAPEGVTLKTDLFRQEWFISAGLNNVTNTLSAALVLVAVIVFLFLTKWRPTLITLLVFPASLALTGLIFYLLGLSVNVMTLGGIAIAIGELVDDAVVSVENMTKRLEGKSMTLKERLQSIIDAILEVRGPIVYSTILVVMVFIPTFFLPGVEGRLLSSLGLAYIISLFASLIVSLTLTPALAGFLLKSDGEIKKVPVIKRWIEEKTEMILNKLFAFWKQIGVIFLVIIILTGVLYVRAGKEGIPSFNEDSLTISVVLPNGTSLDTTNLYAQKLGDDIFELPFVSRVSHITGRAEADPHDSGSNISEMQVVFIPDSAKRINDYTPQIQEVLNRYTGAQYFVGKPITHRVEELLSGVRAPIVIKLYGEDIDELRSYGMEIISLLNQIDGVTNPQLSRDIKVPEIHIYPDRQMLSSMGLSAGEIGQKIESGFIGNEVGEIISGLNRSSVVTLLDNESRNSFSGLRDTSFYDINSSVGNVSAIEISEGRSRISHEGGKRVVIVSSNYEGKDIVGAIDTVKSTLEKQPSPDDIVVSYEGTYQSQKENSLRLGFMFSIIMVLIGLMLFKEFKSWKLVGLIMLNIPVALFGGLIFVYIYGGSINLAHLVGFISLAGLVSRNGILLISRVQALAKESAANFNKAIIVKAVKERAVPILITTLTSGLALLPLMLNGDAPGKEFLHPIAIVGIGGLITSTLTSLFFMPVLLEYFGKKEK
jgi:HME family heavy-metal exporter